MVLNCLCILVLQFPEKKKSDKFVSYHAVIIINYIVHKQLRLDLALFEYVYIIPTCRDASISIFIRLMPSKTPIQPYLFASLHKLEVHAVRLPTEV